MYLIIITILAIIINATINPTASPALVLIITNFVAVLVEFDGTEYAWGKVS